MNKPTNRWLFLIAAFAFCAIAFGAGAFAPVSPPGLDQSAVSLSAPGAGSDYPNGQAVTPAASAECSIADLRFCDVQCYALSLDPVCVSPTSPANVAQIRTDARTLRAFARTTAKQRQRPSVAPHARHYDQEPAPPALIV
jgi:hypothetical protein